jgi:hypothetical protein
MQTIATYLVFMLVLVTLGLSTICATVLSIALYESTDWHWIWSRFLNERSDTLNRV